MFGLKSLLRSHLLKGPLTYNQDGLATRHNADFMHDPRFIEAYRAGTSDSFRKAGVEWRVHVALWCASHAISLEGDFVECGVHTGIMSTAVMTWVDFAKQPNRKFYLFDTWSGIPAEQVSEAEKHSDTLKINRKYKNGDMIYANLLKKLSRWPNSVVVRGRVPDSLSAMTSSKKVAFASIDMNVAAAEIAAAEFLWPRLVPGAPMLLDDYGWAAHINQKCAWDEFAQRHHIMILSLPTGQGLIMKPFSN